MQSAPPSSPHGTSKLYHGTEIDVRGRGRQFRSDFLERFSSAHGLTPLILYTPVVLGALYLAVRAGAAPLTIVGLTLSGLAFWTLFEYWMHRSVFHFNGIPKLHYFLHGIHHLYPNDRGRQVMPPGASLVVAVPMWGVFRLIFGPELSLPIYGGFVAGYIWYDTTHYWTHVGKATSRIGRYLKKHHMRHHFESHERAFGVSTPLWDWVFGTLPGERTRKSTHDQPAIDSPAR